MCTASPATRGARRRRQGLPGLLQESALDGGDYTMDHTAIVYLMDKEGRFVSPFSLKRKPEVAAAELRKYL